jgi:molybdopterin-guanine dinucleotide biosynthesis protein A
MTAGRVPAASGIVLAGGRSSRFGADKLVAPYRGARLIDRAALALAEVTTEVVVVVPPGREAPMSPDLVADRRFRIVHDPEEFGGPLVGLLAGLERVGEPLALLAGGDMPTLVGAVLGAMLRALDLSEADTLALDYRGRPQPLPLAARVGASTSEVRRLLAAGERSLRALLAGRGLARLAEIDWRPLDPSAETLRDIDLPGDIGPTVEQDPSHTSTSGT